uniref:Uncharacterized protein n=2 Tax=Lotharella globosa TaxID=91324 RepID=A0A7S3YGR7_9EUKA|mmetsp:Transcript_15765/g.29772  ORF Transcript_15765/g.29772 Transcript_15765/m.29772 type:complete len:340 (+) Transcript_15765:395-1414(+)
MEASTDSEGHDDAGASNLFGRQWEDKRALWESAKLMKKMSTSIGLGIHASTPERGIRELEGWVLGLHLKHNELHRYDEDDPIRGPVYIRYSSRTGDAYLRENDGKHQGVEFAPKMKSGERLDYGILPMGLYREQRKVALERVPPIDWKKVASEMKKPPQSNPSPRVLSANALRVSNPQELVPPPPPPSATMEAEAEMDEEEESDEFVDWRTLLDRQREKAAKGKYKYDLDLNPKGPGSIFYSVQSFIDKKIKDELEDYHLEVTVERVLSGDVHVKIASDCLGVTSDKILIMWLEWKLKQADDRIFRVYTDRGFSKRTLEIWRAERSAKRKAREEEYPDE